MKRFLVVLILGLILAPIASMAGAPFVRTNGDPQVEGNVTLHGDTTFNGDGTFNLGETEKVYLDGTTISHSAVLFDVDMRTSTAASSAISVDVQLGADVDDVKAVQASATGTTAGTLGNNVHLYHASIFGNASDTDREYNAFMADATKNGGAGIMIALDILNGDWDYAMLAESGDISLAGYAATVETTQDGDVGSGQDLTVRAADGVAAAAEDQAGGNLTLRGGSKANSGVEGFVILPLTADSKVWIDATTAPHTGTAGVLDVDITTATASVTGIDVSTTLTANVDNVHGIKSTFTSAAAGTTEKEGGPFKADIQGHAGDNDDRIHTAYMATGSKNTGNSDLCAFVVKGTEYDNAMTAESGNITFSGYQARVLAEADAPGPGPDLHIQAADGDDNGGVGNPQAGGTLHLYGGTGDNAGTEGGTVLAYNGATAIGGVGVGRLPVAGEGLGVAGKTVLDGDVEIGGTTTLIDTVWEDLRVPFTEAQPGPASNPGFDVFQGAVRAYHFDPDAEEELFFTVQIPHSYKYGTDLHPHIHWAPTTTNTDPARWCLEYTLAEQDGTYGATATLCENDAADGTAYKHQYLDLGDISGAAIDTLSATMVCRVYRDADDGADDYTGDAVGVELDFHFQRDAFGSDEELTK